VNEKTLEVLEKKSQKTNSQIGMKGRHPLTQEKHCFTGPERDVERCR